MDTLVARKMHRTLEAYHGFIYFSSEAADEYAALGAENPTTGYFASRAAPMGAVSSGVVTATFFNFCPQYVESAMADAWDVADPPGWVQARFRAADRTLTRYLGDERQGPETIRAASLARAAADACSPVGRALAAGLMDQSWPEGAHLELWHAISILREFRGDGHVAVLTERGVSAREALLLHAGTGQVPESVLQATRGWPDEAWGATRADLQARGLVAGDGSLTEEGAAFRDDLEARTDRAAMAPWEAVGADACDELRQLVRPFSRSLVEGGAFAVTGEPARSP